MIISGGFNVLPVRSRMRSRHIPPCPVPPRLLAHVKDLKGAVQTPEQLHVLDALPTTAVRKIDKLALRDV